MTIAIGMAALTHLEWQSAFRVASTYGYRSMDIQIDSDSVLTHSVERDGTSRIAEYLARNNMTVGCVSNVRDAELLLGPHTRHTDAMCVGGSAEKIRHATFWAKRAISWARELSAPFVRLYFGCSDHLLMFPWHGYGDSWEANVRSFVASVTEILEFADENNVLVCVETHPRQALFRVDSVNSARSAIVAQGLSLGLCFDPANVMAGGLDPAGYLDALPDPPEILHIKDVEVWKASTKPPGEGWRRYGPGAMARFRDFGFGQVDWAQIAATLKMCHFDGLFVAEFEDPTQTVDKSIARSVAPMQAWVRAME